MSPRSNSTLKKRRDFLVHQGMLELKSRAVVGTTEGEFFLSVDGIELQEEAGKYREWVAAGKPAGGPR
jgi:hypothetical protein